MKRALLITGMALVLTISGFITWLGATEAGLQWLFARVAQATPGELEAQELRGSLFGTVHAKEVRYRAPEITLDIDELDLDWTPAALLIGTLRFAHLHADGVRVVSLPSPEPTPATGQRRLPLRLSLPDVSLRAITILRGDSTRIEIDTFVLDARLARDALTLSQLEITGPTFNLTLAGNLGTNGAQQSDMRVAWSLTPPDYAAIEGTGTLVGDLKHLRIDQEISAPFHANLKADVRDILTALRWQAQLRVQKLNPKHLQPTWPDAQARVDFQAEGDHQSLKGAGKIHIAQQDKTAALDLRLTGRLDNYRLQLDGITDGKNLPHAQWRILAQGNRQGVSFERVEAKLLAGVISGTAAVQWQPQLKWNVDLAAERLNPGEVWAAWPGTIAFSFNAHGANGRSDIRVRDLRGYLHKHRIEGGMRAGIAGDQYTLSELRLRSGTAAFTASGHVKQNWNLQWELRAPEFAALWPGARGTLHSTGQVRGARATPVIVARLAGNHLAIDNHRIDQLQADLHVDLGNRQPSEIRIVANQLTFDRIGFDQIELLGGGLAHAHTLALRARSEYAKIRMEVAGNYGNARWNGTLGAIHIATRDTGDWQLAQPARFELAPGRWQLEEACVERPGGRMCLHGGRPPGAMTKVGFSAQALPLVWFGSLLPETMKLHGTVTGNGQLQFSDRLKQAQADIEFSSGKLSLAPQRAGAEMEYDGASFKLRLNEHGTQANFKLRLPGNDSVTAEISLPQYPQQTSLEQPLRGSLAIKISHLDPLTGLLADAEEMRGDLSADLGIEGTLAQPRMRGQATLANTAVKIPRAGISLSALNITAESDGSPTMRLRGSARSGDGDVRLTGKMNWGPKALWQADVAIAGERFEILNLPEAWVVITPDLRIKAQPQKIDVDGTVAIPQARFAPRRPKEIVPPSPDVVLVNGTDQSAAEIKAWDVSARVRVDLGDKVKFDGFGLTAGVTGSVTTLDQPERATTARGELHITEGKYEAYGQKLQVETGRLIFSGGPIGNPGIDARAVRRTGEVLAGIRVRGTLKAPELTLYSEPPMSQADALAYLLLGRPLREASASEGQMLTSAATRLKLSGGEFLAQRLGARFGFEEVEVETGKAPEDAALVIGKHLSPRLYINYGVGLFEHVNIFRIRYQLSLRWALQAESGTYTGADLLYTIER